METFESLKIKAQRQLSRLLKASERRLEQARIRVEECEGWPQVQHEGLLLQANFHLLKIGLEEISVLDWENDNKPKKILLDPQLDPQQQVAKRFVKTRKLRRGVSHQQDQYAKALKERNRLVTLLEKLTTIKTYEELSEWQESSKISLKQSGKKPSHEAVKKPYREFLSASGLKIWVGRSAKDNETLTFQIAKGSDWWLHARDVSGSHVVIRVVKGAEPDPEALEDAIQLALHYSKAKGGEGEVVITQCKFLKRIKNRLGAVSISKHRTLFTRSDPERLVRLRKRLENKS
jgi:predicted ribosome quality control (RQC) complex YloA/Tae2 family protein